MIRQIALFFALSAALTGCQTEGPQVRVQMTDGQVLVGRLATRHISLKTSVGTFDIDTAHAGEVVMVEGDNIKQSDGMIRLWLRNGSEFVGRWEEPSVEVRIPMGGKQVGIQVPIGKVQRLKFPRPAVWPQQAVFRIQTQRGDDFFVDVTKTKMKFGNEMGSFSPVLSEIRRLKPLDAEKKEWRIQLENGTVFIGELQQEQLALRLEMGPEKINLPLSQIRAMNRQVLVPPQSNVPSEDASAAGFYSSARQKAAKVKASQRSRQ